MTRRGGAVARCCAALRHRATIHSTIHTTIRATCGALAVVVLAACGPTTVVEPAADPASAATSGADVGDVPVGAQPALEDNELIEGGVIVDDTPVTTVAAAGSPAELLPELATELSRLGSLVAEGDGDDESLARIEAIWAEISGEVRDTRPELVDGIEATIEMARTAVTATQPADADKAFGILTDLVDKFFGE